MKTIKSINIHKFTKIYLKELNSIKKNTAGFDEVVEFFIDDFLPFQYDFVKEFYSYLNGENFEISQKVEYNGKEIIYYSLTNDEMAAFAFTVTHFDEFNAYY